MPSNSRTSNTGSIRQIQVDEHSMSFSEVSADSTPTDVHSRRQWRFIWWHWLLILSAVAITLALAWWQYCRFNSISGTAQNLGYTLQWPFFGAFVVFGYLKYRALDRQSCDISTSKESINHNQRSFFISRLLRLESISYRSSTGVAHEIPPGILPPKPQDKSVQESFFTDESENEYNSSVGSWDSDTSISEDQQVFEYNHYLRSLAYRDEQGK